MARMVQARESRVRTERTGDGLLIHVARRRTWWRFGFPAWAALIVGFGLVSMLTSEPPENSGGVLFLILWAAIGLATVVGSLWGCCIASSCSWTGGR